MSLSTPKLTKFLLDENVRLELYKLLEFLGIDIKLSPKGTTDVRLAEISLKEKRIIITNDQDFTEYPKNKIFSVIWLKIPQNDPNELVSSFKKLLDENTDFSGRLIILEPGKWEVHSLPIIH